MNSKDWINARDHPSAVEPSTHNLNTSTRIKSKSRWTADHSKSCDFSQKNRHKDGNSVINAEKNRERNFMRKRRIYKSLRETELERVSSSRLTTTPN